MKIYRFWILLVSILMTWTACDNSKQQVESPKPITTDDIANQDSDPIDSIATQTTSEIDTLEVNFETLMVAFENLKTDNTFKNPEEIVGDTIEILLNKGQLIEDQIFKCFGEEWRSPIIEQRIIANVLVQNRNKTITLRDWKQYKSDWEQVGNLSRGIYKTAAFPENVHLEFPSLSEKELYLYLNNVLKEKEWARLIVEPEYGEGEKHWAIGISELQLRFKGHFRKGIKRVKHIHFKIPMGI